MPDLEFTSDSTSARDAAVSRRAFLAGATTAAAALALGGASALADEALPAGAVPAAGSAIPGPAIASVVMAQDPHIVPVRIAQQGLLRSYLDKVIRTLAGKKETGDAWRHFLGDDDNILIKFSQSMAALLGTSGAMAEALVASLKAADLNPERMILLEVGQETRGRTKTRQPDHRWQDQQVEFGPSGTDCFRADVDWATAIINVPFLKTHHRAVMTSSLKNLSHGLIRHPARFHGDGCAPGIAEINAAKELRSRVKLNIVNGLRLNFAGGPDGSESEIANAGLLLAGVDPVACDSIGFRQINKVRSERGMGPILAGPTLPRQLTLAESLGVGTANPERIELQIPE